MLDVQSVFFRFGVHVFNWKHAMTFNYLHALRSVVFLVILAGCGGGSGGGSANGQAGGQPASGKMPVLALQAVATALSSPLFLTAPSGDQRLFIVERGGKIRIVQDGSLLTTAFLDIHSSTTTDGERGLLSMAFDPQYASNGFFYVYFTDLNGNIAIERFSVSPNPNVADPLSGLRIMSIPHPAFSNHNGGLLTFGPDGFLYIGTGDGGGAGDPNGNAQNTGSVLGKLLRIDVSASTTARPYSVPASNPFINQAGKRAEIWAVGLRNPWRYAFDAASNLLYIADVGQDQREEVDVATVNQAGLNYGWNIMEGTLCFAGGACNQHCLLYTSDAADE